RWRSRSGRGNCCFLFFPFRSARFLLHLLGIGQWPKLHDFCLHRAVGHFIIRTPHLLISDHVFHRRGLATLGDDGFVGNLQDTRIFSAGDAERFCLVIHCVDHALVRSSSPLSASRCFCRGGCIRICGTASVRRRKRFLRRGLCPKREANE